MYIPENNSKIDRTWTLFLDRDGVINVEQVGSYITKWDDFHFHEGVLEAINHLSQLFGKIIVVSNQRGVGKGIMALEDLKDINLNLQNTIAKNGGRLDKIYNCTAIEDSDRNRKPNTGMGLQANIDFPDIDFRKSIMVGNSISDMEFGKRLFMHTVYLTTKSTPYPLPHPLIDNQHASLYDWMQTILTGKLEKIG